LHFRNPNELTESVHDRLPVITQYNNIIETWLNLRNEISYPSDIVYKNKLYKKIVGH
jgi:hypothetical protein